MLKKLAELWEWLWAPLRRGGTPSRHGKQPPISFDAVQELNKLPSNDALLPGQFISVSHHGKLFWTVFRCPCGCGDVISLPMSPPHNPRWQLSTSSAGRPTLYPSVWRNKGCKSHFWLTDGRVYWSEGSGTEPWKARPDIYDRKK